MITVMFILSAKDKKIAKDKTEDKLETISFKSQIGDQSELNNKLIWHVADNNLSEVKKLLDQGAQLNAKIRLNQDILRIIKKKIHSEQGKIIIGESKIIKCTRSRPDILFTPLMLSAFAGHTEMVRFLIDNGADVNADVNGFFNASNLAAMEGHTDILNILIDSGANIEEQNSQIIMSAASGGHIETLGRMFKIYPTLNTQNNKNIALIGAVLYGHAELVKHLITNGADVNTIDPVDVSKTVGPSVLHTAASKGYAEIVQILLENGADVDAVDYFGRTPLFYAAKEEHIEIIHMLMKHYAKVNAHDGEGTSILRIAKNKEIIEILKKSGAKE